MEHLPIAFVDRMRNQLGNEAEAFFHSLTQPAATSIRLHPVKGVTAIQNLEKVIWCEEGHYLSVRPFFHLDPLWHAGAYYVQEASSMILDEVIKQLKLDDKNRIWLDMCAAPGGKTGILAKHMQKGDVLIANEVVPARRAVLKENLVKGGYMNTFITGLQSKYFDHHMADILLVDAPCAGEGMMRKEPEAIRQWSPKLVEECAFLQSHILEDAYKILNPGGYLIYSTCSYSDEENIMNVASLVNSSPLETVALEFPDEWSIATLSHNGTNGYQLYPHRVKGEGLFIAVLQKNSSEISNSRSKRNAKHFQMLPGWMNQIVDHTDCYLTRETDGQFVFITKEAEEKANEVIDKLQRIEILSEIGQLKGKDFIPSHFLAMASKQNKGFEVIELTESQALDYLERKIDSLPEEKMNGWYVVSYKNVNLGWAKKTSQGWKNHYPLPWRLRMRKM